jgi:hypothetical protein
MSIVVDRIQIDPNGYARWSPDGIGYYYYDSLEEALTERAEGLLYADIIHLRETFDEYDERTERY